MLLFRKMDYYGQLILASLMVLSIPFLLFYGSLAGLFILGCWQLVSAVSNTNAFLSLSQRKQIWLYWKLCIADFTLLFLGWLSGNFFTADTVQFVFGTAIAGAIFIAVYYLKIYNKVIELISLRNELDGLTKSKH